MILESGLGDAAAFWVGVQQVLATTCRTLSYDRAGLGGSDPAEAPRTLENMVGDTSDMIEALGIGEPAVLVGHSWGGPMVRLLAERAPGLARRVMLVDPTFSAILGGDALRWVLPMFWWWYAVSRFGGRRVLLRRFRDGRWPEMSKDDIDIALADHWTSADLRTSICEAREIRGAYRLLHDLEERPSAVPIRILVGMRRPEPLRTIMASECARIAAISPDGSSVQVDDAGHSIPQERPRRTASEIWRFAEA